MAAAALSPLFKRQLQHDVANDGVGQAVKHGCSLPAALGGPPRAAARPGCHLHDPTTTIRPSTGPQRRVHPFRSLHRSRCRRPGHDAWPLLVSLLAAALPAARLPFCFACSASQCGNNVRPLYGQMQRRQWRQRRRRHSRACVPLRHRPPCYQASAQACVKRTPSSCTLSLVSATRMLPM